MGTFRITRASFSYNGITLKRYYDKDGLSRCTRHNEYKGVRFPGTGCLHCIARYDDINGTDYLCDVSRKEKLAAFSKKKVKPKKDKVKKVTKPVNRIAICLDRSQSMYTLGKSVKEKLLETVLNIEKDSKEFDQETTLTLIDFESSVRVIFSNLPISEAVAMVKDYDYKPSGMTALFTAVERAILDLSYCDDVDDPNTSFLVIAITDGGDNRSFMTVPTITKMLREPQATDRWSFAFQLPRGYANGFARSFDLPPGNIMEWDAGSVKGLIHATLSTQRATTNYYASRAAGQTKSTSFFADLSKVTDKDINKLVDVKSKVKIYTVNKECVIKDFLESKNKDLEPGKAYYQLTKTEPKVQAYKKIIIMEKGKKSVYTGDEARKLLGLPTSGTIRLKPGNHANYDVFIQSTSYNRKLVRGTKLVYFKD